MMPLTPRRSVRRCDGNSGLPKRIRAPYLTTLWTTRVLLRKRHSRPGEARPAI